MSKLFGSREIDEQARAWVIELDDEAPSEERLAELRAWLQRSPLHRRAFEQAAAAWRTLDSLTQLLQHEAVAPVARDPVAPTRGVMRWRPALAFVAIVLLVIGALLSIDIRQRPHAAPAAAKFYATATGEVSTVTLSDGSRLFLNTASRVSVTYAADARTLQLLAGEAYFEVAPSPQRPFVVYAGRFSVRALGTAFAVHMLGSGVDLTVTQGQVELASFKRPPNPGSEESQSADARYPVSGGQHVSVNADVRVIEQIDAKGIEKHLAWREGELLFDDDPLEKVVAEIGRYSATRIVIADPSIRNVKIGGYFKVQDINSILNTLQESFGIEVKKDANVVYLVRGRSAQ